MGDAKRRVVYNETYMPCRKGGVRTPSTRASLTFRIDEDDDLLPKTAYSVLQKKKYSGF